MNRRHVITLVGGAAALPIAAWAWRLDRQVLALVGQILGMQAERASFRISQFIYEIVSQIGWTTQLPWPKGSMDQRRFDALRLLRQVPAITELAFLDDAGIEQVKVSRLAMDVTSKADMSNEPKFAEAMAHHVYFGPVYYRSEVNTYITVALAGRGREYGVSVAEVSPTWDWFVAKTKVGKSGTLYMVDGNNRLIAHPDFGLVRRETDMSNLAQVQAARAAGDSPTPARAARDIKGRDVLSVSASVPPLGWRVFVELPVAEIDTVVSSAQTSEAG